MSAARIGRQAVQEASHWRRADRKRQAAARRHRKALAAEREALERAIELAIERLDQIDGDPDFEVDVDDEDGGDGHPSSLSGAWHLGPGDADDAEENGDAEPDFDNERSHNAPVSETILGEAALGPHSAPTAVDWSRAECLPGLPDVPDGYVPIRVVSNRMVER